jgi:hypothetical protein
VSTSNTRFFLGAASEEFDRGSMKLGTLMRRLLSVSVWSLRQAASVPSNS